MSRYTLNPLFKAMLPLSVGFAWMTPTVVTASEGARVIEEIVVTARKREESIQRIPTPVTCGI